MTLHLILFLLKCSEAVCCAGSDIKQLQYNILWSALQKLNKSISKGKVTLFRVFWWAGGIKDIDGFKFLKFYNHYTSHSSQFCVHTPVPLCSRLFAWHDFFFSSSPPLFWNGLIYCSHTFHNYIFIPIYCASTSVCFLFTGVIVALVSFPWCALHVIWMPVFLFFIFLGGIFM